jgi:hypothetical protein
MAFRNVPAEPEPFGAVAARQAAQQFSLDAQTDRMLALYGSLGRPAQIA